MIKRILSISMVVIFSLSLFVGCGKGKTSEAENTQSTEASQSVEATKTEPQKISISHNQGEDFHPVLKSMADKYNELTGNTAEYIYVPATEYKNWITTQFAADNAPDIVSGGDLNKAQISEYYKNGWFAEVTQYLEEVSPYANKKWKDIFLPDMLTPATATDLGNKVLGIPSVSVSKDMFYNKDIFKEVGIEKVPESLSELLDACKKIKEHGKYIPFSAMIQPTLQWNTWFIERQVMVDFWDDVIPTLDVMSVNGQLDMEEQALGVKSGIMNPGDQRMVDYFKFMKELAKYFQPGFASADWSYEGLFNEGKSAITTNGMWYIKQHETANLTVDYGIARIPYVDKAISEYTPGVLRKFASQGELGLNYLTQKSVKDNRATTAIDYLMYMTDSKTGGKILIDGYGFLPVTEGFDLTEGQKAVMATKGDVKNTMPEIYIHKFTPEASQKYNVMLTKFLTDKTSPEEFVEKQYKPLVESSCDDLIKAHDEWKIDEYVSKVKK